MAWPSVDQMREEVSRVYNWDGWASKVNEMPDKQVAAIYNRMLSNGFLKKEPKKKDEVPPAFIGKTFGQVQEMHTVWRLNCVTEDDVTVGEQIKFKI